MQFVSDNQFQYLVIDYECKNTYFCAGKTSSKALYNHLKTKL